jgi:hypothetical protein
MSYALPRTSDRKSRLIMTCMLASTVAVIGLALSGIEGS